MIPREPRGVEKRKSGRRADSIWREQQGKSTGPPQQQHDFPDRLPGDGVPGKPAANMTNRCWSVKIRGGECDVIQRHETVPL